MVSKRGDEGSGLREAERKRKGSGGIEDERGDSVL